MVLLVNFTLWFHLLYFFLDELHYDFIIKKVFVCFLFVRCYGRFSVSWFI